MQMDITLQMPGNTSGILFLALPVFGYLLSGHALRRLPDNRARLRYASMIGLPCVIMPLIIICSVWESGYAVRYTADFSWEIVIGALLVHFLALQREQKRNEKEYVERICRGICNSFIGDKCRSDHSICIP